MKPSQHVMISTVVSVGVQETFHSWPATAVCFLSGILIDLDHHLEFYLDKGRIPRYQELVDFCTPYQGKKLYVVFHAWEYLIVLWILIFALHLNAIWIGFAIGLTTHLMADQLYNPAKSLCYFMTYRISKGFEAKELMKPEGIPT